MNIFFLSTNPELAVLDHCDKHVVKMVLETTQMMCTAHRLLDGDVAADAMGLYKTAYANHPMTKWVRENQFNYAWTYRLLKELCSEYTYRYDRVHATQSKGILDALQKVPENICLGTETGRTVPPMCMPDKYKNRFTGKTTFTDVVDAYRRYYITIHHYLLLGEKKDFARWTNRPQPKWWPVSAKTYDCSLCKETFKGYGNNPWPLAEGRCCDDCNVDVLVARVAGLQERQNARTSKDT
tara:strand:+ start:99 stop:815 length:717 start_codon:yes stop_codon:yes gene_type:complete